MACGKDLNEDRFVLAGRTGSGKSTTGNTILGRKSFEACMSASSVTSVCQREVAIMNGTSYVIVDTPGLFDTRLSRMELSKEVVRCVSMSSPGPHIFLLTVNVGRFTKEEIDCFTEIFELFGENLNRYSIIVFTGKDQLQFEEKSIENFISGCKELKDIIAKCNNNYIAINNKAKGEQLNFEIEQLMQKIHSVIASNQNQHYTNEMFREAELAFKRKEKKLKEEAEKKKKEEHDIIRAEMRDKVKACEKENKGMLQKVAALENEKYILQQSAKHDEQQVQLITATIASLNESMKCAKEENARMMENIQQLHEKMVNKIEENSQAEIDSIKKASQADQSLVEKLDEMMTKSEEQHQNQIQTLLDTNKDLMNKLQEKKTTCTVS